MRTVPPTRPHVRPALDYNATPRWLVGLLVVCLVSLVFQLFPSLWWAFLGVLDVRGWTWRSYSAVFAIVIVLLVALRACQERSR